MMYLIPIFVIILSLFGIFYIVVRKIQTLQGDRKEELIYSAQSARKEKNFREERRDVFKYNILGKTLANMGAGDTLFIFMEKLFRRTRVRLMKIENFLTNWAEGLHQRRLKRGLRQGPTSNGAGQGLEERQKEEKIWLLRDKKTRKK